MFDHPFFAVMAPIDHSPFGGEILFGQYQFDCRFNGYW